MNYSSCVINVSLVNQILLSLSYLDVHYATGSTTNDADKDLQFKDKDLKSKDL